MIVKIATESDIPQLANLLAILFEQEAEFKSDYDAQIEGLRLIIQNAATGTILALEANGFIIGMVNILYTVSTALGGKVAILEDMVISPNCRGSGAGSLLIRSAIETAETAGCLRITLLMDRDNLRAKGFYEKHGFVESAMVPLRLKLTDKAKKNDEIG